MRHSIFKTIAVLSAAVLGLAAVVVVGVAAYFVYHLVVPEKMDITGRVTDSAGQPLAGIEIRAVPVYVYDPYSDSAMKPQDTEHTAISDKNGRYRFKRLVASVGIKEGRCMQGYDIVARAEGRSSPAVRVCKHPDDRRSAIELDDIVIEVQGRSEAGAGGS